MENIVSITNSRVANVRKLISSRDYRYECNCYIAEGANIVNDMPRDEIIEIFMTADSERKLNDAYNLANKITYVSDKVMQAMSDTKSPSGILAVCRMPQFGNIADTYATQSILLDGLNDPGNMGTIIRTAVACGVRNILLYGSCVDIYSPKVVRASMGGITNILPINVTDVRVLKGNIIALDMAGENIYQLTEVPKEFIIVVGSEAHGVSEEIRTLATSTISLPMSEKMESLNAGVSLSIALYHLINGGK